MKLVHQEQLWLQVLAAGKRGGGAVRGPRWHWFTSYQATTTYFIHGEASLVLMVVEEGENVRAEPALA